MVTILTGFMLFDLLIFLRLISIACNHVVFLLWHGSRKVTGKHDTQALVVNAPSILAIERRLLFKHVDGLVACSVGTIFTGCGDRCRRVFGDRAMGRGSLHDYDYKQVTER